MRVKVDQDLCIGCGKCESLCPDVFVLTDNGVSEVIQDNVPDTLLDEVKEAEESCPVSAISRN